MNNKKILIFSSKGGGGHLSAAAALNAYLEKGYYLETAYIFDDVLGVVDPFKIMSKGHYSAEEFYNTCLRRRWIRLINILCTLSPYLFRLTVFETLVKKFIAHKKPDMVISVVPLVNGLIEAGCVSLNIPFLVIPTDLDVRTFIGAMKYQDHKKIKIALTFNDALILKSFSQAKIPHKKVCLTGFPLKPSFFGAHKASQIHQDFNIPDNKPIILLLMGAVGSHAMIPMVQELIKIAVPAHILICLGRNEALRKKLEMISYPFSISSTIISQTDRIADLMSIAWVCITKSGTVSLCETLYKQVPMIIDAIALAPLWEQFNHTFVQYHGFGEVVHSYDELRVAVERILTSTSYVAQIRKNLAHYQKVHFGTTITKVVEEMIH